MCAHEQVTHAQHKICMLRLEVFLQNNIAVKAVMNRLNRADFLNPLT